VLRLVNSLQRHQNARGHEGAIGEEHGPTEPGSRLDVANNSTAGGRDLGRAVLRRSKKRKKGRGTPPPPMCVVSPGTSSAKQAQGPFFGRGANLNFMPRVPLRLRAVNAMEVVVGPSLPGQKPRHRAGAIKQGANSGPTGLHVGVTAEHCTAVSARAPGAILALVVDGLRPGGHPAEGHRGTPF